MSSINVEPGPYFHFSLRVRDQESDKPVCVSFSQNDQHKINLLDDEFVLPCNIFRNNGNLLNLFTSQIQPLIDLSLNGMDANIFFYGGTESGKTYTMGSFNDENTFHKDLGMIIRTCTYLFNKIRSDLFQKEEYIISVNYISHNYENSFELTHFGDKINSTSCNNFILTSSIELKKLLTEWNNFREKFESNICDMFIFNISKKHAGDLIFQSKINFIDLSSSVTNTVKNTITRMFQRLCYGENTDDGEKIFKPFLFNPFHTNSFTLLIGCISPFQNHFIETKSTLLFFNSLKETLNDEFKKLFEVESQLVSLDDFCKKTPIVKSHTTNTISKSDVVDSSEKNQYNKNDFKKSTKISRTFTGNFNEITRRVNEKRSDEELGISKETIDKSIKGLNNLKPNKNIVNDFGNKTRFSSVDDDQIETKNNELLNLRKEKISKTRELEKIKAEKEKLSKELSDLRKKYDDNQKETEKRIQMLIYDVNILRKDRVKAERDHSVKNTEHEKKIKNLEITIRRNEQSILDLQSKVRDSKMGKTVKLDSQLNENISRPSTVVSNLRRSKTDNNVKNVHTANKNLTQSKVTNNNSWIEPEYTVDETNNVDTKFNSVLDIIDKYKSISTVTADLKHWLSIIEYDIKECEKLKTRYEPGAHSYNDLEKTLHQLNIDLIEKQQEILRVKSAKIPSTDNFSNSLINSLESLNEAKLMIEKLFDYLVMTNKKLGQVEYTVFRKEEIIEELKNDFNLSTENIEQQNDEFNRKMMYDDGTKYLDNVSLERQKNIVESLININNELKFSEIYNEDNDEVLNDDVFNDDQRISIQPESSFQASKTKTTQQIKKPTFPSKIPVSKSNISLRKSITQNSIKQSVPLTENTSKKTISTKPNIKTSNVKRSQSSISGTSFFKNSDYDEFNSHLHTVRTNKETGKKEILLSEASQQSAKETNKQNISTTQKIIKQKLSDTESKPLPPSKKPIQTSKPTGKNIKPSILTSVKQTPSSQNSTKTSNQNQVKNHTQNLKTELTSQANVDQVLHNIPTQHNVSATQSETTFEPVVFYEALKINTLAYGFDIYNNDKNVVTSGNHEFNIWDIVNKTKIQEFRLLDIGPHILYYEPQNAIYCSSKNRVSVFDPRQEQSILTFKIGAETLQTIESLEIKKFHIEKERLFTVSDNYLSVWDIRNNKFPINSCSIKNAILKSITPSPLDENELYITSSLDMYTLYDYVNMKEINYNIHNIPNTEIRDIKIVNNFVYSFFNGSYIQKLSFPKFEMIYTGQLPGSTPETIISHEFLNTSNSIITGTDFGNLYVWNITTMESSLLNKASNVPISLIKNSPNDNLFFMTNDGFLTVYKKYLQ